MPAENVKGLNIYIPTLTGKPWPAAVYNWSGVMTLGGTAHIVATHCPNERTLDPAICSSTDPPMPQPAAKAESEALVWAARGNWRLKQWVLRRRRKVCDEKQAWMPAGCEFHTERTAMLKPREAKVMWTRRTNNRLVLEGLLVTSPKGH